MGGDNVIRKTDSIQHVREVLEAHDVPLPNGWEIAMGMLLEGCDRMEVCGYGHHAQFTIYDAEDGMQDQIPHIASWTES